MGGGNGAKSAMAREKNLKKKQAEQKQAQRKENNKNGPPVGAKCSRCMMVFGVTSKKPELVMHCDNKHPDYPFEVSFAGWTPVVKKKGPPEKKDKSKKK